MDTTETSTSTEQKDRTAQTTPVQKQIAAMLGVAGRRKNDPTVEAWKEEIARYREQLRREEIARQETESGEK